MKKPRPQTALGALLRVLWQQPLLAIPFAFFFSLLFGGFPGSLRMAYLISLIFAFTVGVAIWAVRWLVLRNHEGLTDWKKPALFYGVSSVGASMLGALIVEWTLIPGFVTGSGRNVAVVLMFAVLFCALFMGIGMAIGFYRESIESAKAEQELHLARRIQRSFLLSNFPQRPRLEIHAVNLSSRQVSGDFYDVVAIGDDGVLVAIADVSGKGVPAALLSSMLQASVRTQAAAGPSVAGMIEKVNTLVCQRPATGQFATFFLAWIDERTMRMRYTNAGHNFPVMLGGNGRRTLEAGGTVVGMMEALTWSEEEVPLAPGDRVIMYTDGVTEAANAEGEMYGEDRLYAVLDAMPRDLTASSMVDRVLEELRRFLDGTEPGDDITVLALRVLEDPAGRS